MSAFHRNTWIRIERRIAIYIRDNFTCAFCGIKYDRDQLSLDHIHAVSCGGGNENTNLVTCCKNCNSRKGNMPITQFVKDIDTLVQILWHVYHSEVNVALGKEWYANNKQTAPDMRKAA